MSSHNFDHLTGYCITCGRALEFIIEHKIECTDKKVSGISHKIKRKQMEERLEQLHTSPKDNDTTT